MTTLDEYLAKLPIKEIVKASYIRNKDAYEYLAEVEKKEISQRAALLIKEERESRKKTKNDISPA